MEPYQFVVPAGHKAGAVCGEEGGRFLEESVLVIDRKGEGYAVATNGRALSALPLGTSGPTSPLFVDPAAVNANGLDKTVIVGTETRTIAGKKQEIFDNPQEDGRYPGFGSCFPPAKDVCQDYLPVCLNAEYLRDLASAIATGGIVVLFLPLRDAQTGTVQKPIPVVGLTEEGTTYGSCRGLGVIVPLLLEKAECVNVLQHYERHANNFPTAGMKFEKGKLVE